MAKTAAVAVAAAVLAVVGASLWGLRLLPHQAGPRHATAQEAASGGSAAPAGRQAAGGRSAGRPAAAPLAGTARPAAVPAGWRLAFAGRFRGSRLDTSVWSTCYPWADPAAGCTNSGNGETQWYLPGQVRVSGGVLHLVARHKRTAGRSRSGRRQVYECRSGMVTSYPGFRFRFGYVQATARLPSRPGLWPALWLAAADQRWPPEMDLVEHWGRERRATGVFFHPVGAPAVAAWPVTGNLGVGWHTFALYWSRHKLTWRIDGRVVLSVRRHVPRQRMYFIANLADFARSGRGCSGQLLLRSVRVWQP